MVTEHPSAPSASEAAKHHSELDEFERQNGRPPFILTYAEVKLLGIAGVSSVSAAWLRIEVLTRYLFMPQGRVLLGW